MIYLKKTHLRQVRQLISTSFKEGGKFSVTLCGKEYKVAYETKHIKEDRDYGLLRHLAKGRKLILDVGCNVGISSLLLSEGNSASIHAFEASEESARLAILHGAWNGIDNRVTVVNALLTNRSGDTVPFYWEHTSAGASINAGYLGHNKPIFKNTLALDDYIAANNLKPDFIKMDIEGAEWLALQGLIKTITAFSPLILVEVHSFGDTTLQQNVQLILDLIKPLRYEMIYVKELRIVAHGNELNRGRCHVLLCPVGFDYKNLFADFNTTGL